MKQDNKKVNLIILVISLTILSCVVVWLWYTVVKFSDCSYTQEGVFYMDSACQDFYEGQQDKLSPFLISFLSLLPITLILFFVRRETFFLWAKFAAVAFPVMLGTLLYTFHNESGGGSWVGGPTNAQFAAFALPPLFLLISLILITYKTIKLRGK